MWARVDLDGRSERGGCRVACQRRSARRERCAGSAVPQPVRRSSGCRDVISTGQCRLERGERDRRRTAPAPRCSLAGRSRRSGRRCRRNGNRGLVSLRRRAGRRQRSPRPAGGASGEGRFRTAAESREGNRTDRESTGRATRVPAMGGRSPSWTQERDRLCDSGRRGADNGSEPRLDRSAVGAEDELGTQRRRRRERGPHLEGCPALDDFAPHHRTHRGRSPRQAIVPPRRAADAGRHQSSDVRTAELGPRQAQQRSSATRSACTLLPNRYVSSREDRGAR